MQLNKSFKSKSIFVTTPLINRQIIDCIQTQEPKEDNMKNRFPEGWNEKKVKTVLSHYEKQTENEAVEEDELPMSIYFCKNCGHAVTMGGGLCFHTENGFSQTCKICGCRLPEYDDGEIGEKA